MYRDSVWLQPIHQEILYATTERFKKQSQLSHQMYLPSLRYAVRTQLHPSSERFSTDVPPLQQDLQTRQTRLRLKSATSVDTGRHLTAGFNTCTESFRRS
ncbi:hypothetical protein C0557_15305 [Kosakonia sp. MUSA4]|nr:hypothetical protein C0557_15305 [Kosakonia sp. MUSA4]